VRGYKGCLKGCLQLTINLYINKEEKTKERRTLYYSSINTNVYSGYLGNILYNNSERKKKLQIP
jgi:hypothetical protein